MKKLICLLLILTFALPLVGCEISRSYINGANLKDFKIVYSENDLDYAKRAAKYIQSEILERTGLKLPIVKDGEADSSKYEIVVGNTNRDISTKLDAKTEGLEFAILADGGSVALEGDYFIIAAAAYFFIENYVPIKDFDAKIPTETKVYQPIVKEAKNYIMLIGDGMGVYQTKLFEYMENNVEYGDGEDVFYGYYLPYMGYSRTQSLSGVTDSAAGGTALACGYKTINEYIGRDKDKNDIKSLTELAIELGMSGGVMSTETSTGATPASFSAHAYDRDNSLEIRTCQALAKKNLGMQINCGYNYYTSNQLKDIEMNIEDMLNTLDNNEKGFFLMYEEAYIDKHSHDNNIDKALEAVVRFNQAIGRFMEFAFYNPNTFVLITADHETGGLAPNENGVFKIGRAHV